MTADETVGAGPAPVVGVPPVDALEVDDGLLVLYDRTVVRLTALGRAAVELCSTPMTEAEIAEALSDLFGEPPGGDLLAATHAVVDDLDRPRPRTAPSSRPPPRRRSRRRSDRSATAGGTRPRSSPTRRDSPRRGSSRGCVARWPPCSGPEQGTPGAAPRHRPGRGAGSIPDWRNAATGV